jgi:hypothetical protein
MSLKDKVVLAPAQVQSARSFSLPGMWLGAVNNRSLRASPHTPKVQFLYIEYGYWSGPC